MSRRQFLKWTAGVGASFAGYATVIEPTMRLRVQPWSPRPAAWPRGFALRIAAIADPHAGAPSVSEARIERVVAETNAIGADLIVLLGDYAASHRFVSRRIPIEWTARAFGQLSAPLGVYAVLGNHDWWDDPDALRRGAGPTRSHRAFDLAGVPVLENSVVTLEKDGRRFRLAGLADQLAFPPFFVRRAGGTPHPPNPAARRPAIGLDDLPKTLAAGDPELPTILLAHEPDIFPAVPASVALTLSGHTHGGQVQLLGWRPMTGSEYGARYVYGLVEEQGKALVVSGGIGCSMLPVRVGVPPEIVLVDLA